MATIQVRVDGSMRLPAVATSYPANSTIFVNVTPNPTGCSFIRFLRI